MPAIDTLYDEAVKLLAKRNYSAPEISRLLAKQSDDADQIQGTVDALIAENYLNDARIAEYLAEKAVGKGQGPGRIRQLLRLRTLETDLVENTVNSLDADWFKMAQTIRDKMFEGSGPLDQKQKGKLVRKLQCQGFSMDVVREIVEG